VARWEQAKVAYEAAVYRSLGEASTAITTYGRLADAERHQADAVAAADRAVRIARSRYLSGLADYLEVLQAQQLLFPAEQTLTELRFERLAALVDLYRALGGGWYLSVDEWGHAQPASNRAPTSS
jgi:multidrug efflux system outer membrane protein